MATPIITDNNRDAVLTQLLSVAAVLVAFPAVTLSGGAKNRLATAVAAKVTTPANAQIIDESGDLLAVTFLTANPFTVLYTTKGLARKEAEAARGSGL